MTEMFGTFALSVGAAVSMTKKNSLCVFLFNFNFQNKTNPSHFTLVEIATLLTRMSLLANENILLTKCNHKKNLSLFTLSVRISQFEFCFASSQVGMEFWARWAHKALWHASLWHMHESHHRPRDGPFELNDIFAIINAVPAISLMSYGFLHRGLVPGLCFGAVRFSNSPLTFDC